MRNFVLVLLTILLFAGCSAGTSISFDIPFEGEEKSVCEDYSNYLKLMSKGEYEKTFEYEDMILWPSLIEERYIEMRSSYPAFSSLLSKSKVKFTQCSKQPEWGIYGQTYKNAYIIAFEFEYTETLTSEEKVFADLIDDRDNVTVMIRDEQGNSKFLPSIGPEILPIDDAMKAYQDYISIIINKEWSRIYDFTPSAITEVTPKEQIASDWDTEDGQNISEFASQANIEPIIGQIVFEPSIHGINYRWGVNLYVLLDLESIDQSNLTELQKLIIDDYRMGVNSKVLLVPEGDDWKVSAENPLF